MVIICHDDRNSKSLTIKFRVNLQHHRKTIYLQDQCQHSVCIICRDYTSVLHCHLWPLTPSLPVHRAHNSDLSLWHTNSCVGGSEQSVDHYLPWLIDNRLQKNTNRESREKNTPVTDTRNPELWLHKQRLSNITGNNGSVCVCVCFCLAALFYGTGAFMRQTKIRKIMAVIFIKYILFKKIWGGGGKTKTHKFQTNAQHLWKAYA